MEVLELLKLRSGSGVSITGLPLPSGHAPEE
jgi:hypothetical protein